MMIRLAIQRWTAPLAALIPDMSGFSPRDRVLIGVGASLFLHVVAFFVMVLLAAIMPAGDFKPPEPPREIELTIVSNDPEPEPVLPMAPNPQQRFLDTSGLDISKAPPVNPDFEASENGIAASELPATGNIPLPSQTGRDLPFLAFQSQRALFGPSPKPFPADAESVSLNDPAKAEPASDAPDVVVKPIPAPVPTPPPVKIAKTQPAATPPPPATPPPKSEEKTETPAVAQATPPPLKTVDKVKEDEIAITSKPPATPPPSTADTERPQPIAAATPPPPLPMPTPRKAMQQVMLVTPSPKTQPPARSSTQLEQEQNRLEGGISNRGKRAVNSVATPLGKYHKQVMDAIGSRWQYYVKSHSDVLALGSAQVSFIVDGFGKIRAVRVENNTSNQSFADICERAIREAEIPEAPAEALAPMRGGRLEISINFTLYSTQ